MTAMKCPTVEEALINRIVSLRRITKSKVCLLLLVVLLLTSGVVLGCNSQEPSDADQVRISLPTGWEEDIEYGVAQIEEAGLPGNTVYFFGGNPVVGGYNPNIFVLKQLVPRGTTLKEYADANIAGSISSATPLDDRNSSRLAGGPAEVATFISRPGIPDRVIIKQWYLMRGNTVWIAQCTGLLADQGGMEICENSLTTLEFE